MARAYSLDLRERVVALVEGGQTTRAAAVALDVRAESVVKWTQRARSTGSAAAKAMGGKRPFLLEAERDWLLARLNETPDQTLHALTLSKCWLIAVTKGEEIRACEQAGITVTLPKPQTTGSKALGRFGKPDFVYLPVENVYRCLAGEKLSRRFTAQDEGLTLHRYWTSGCRTCQIKAQCTVSKERRISRWEHEHVVEAVQTRLDKKSASNAHSRAN